MKIIKSTLFLMITVALFNCNSKSSSNVSLQTEVDSVSYAIGLNISKQMRVNFREVNKEAILRGLEDGIDSSGFVIPEKDVTAILNTYFQKKQAEQRKEQEAKAKKDAEEKFADNKKAGEAFLASNKMKKGVQTTASGLQYQVLKTGKGKKPNPTSIVKLHYHGTTIKGEVFDSSVDRKKPYELKVNQFVKGFSEGLLMMNVGSKYKFFIPQELAYGYQNRGEKIPPFSALVFEVELLDIIKE
ncbi:MAG: peptidylprolyl isomerase [Flavobacteriaceae bacterium]|nr:peptidylprolyl isomerase [Flavobacteriaceae bacterium]|tara:strand:- start:30885 stop:31613 length:729 start_codon:yes stop_codon:yes gene_type:complete